MPLLWRRRHGVFRIGEGDGRHGGSAGELLSSPLPWLPRSGDRPRLLTARQERLGGGDGGSAAPASAGACFLRRRGMIPASQERFLRSLGLSLSSSDLWWRLPKSVESTENLPPRRLSYPMSPSSSEALPP
jgi:hypothetical protein